MAHPLRAEPYIDRYGSFLMGEICKSSWSNYGAMPPDDQPRGEFAYNAPSYKGAKIIENMTIGDVTSLVARNGTARIKKFPSSFFQVVSVDESTVYVLTSPTEIQRLSFNGTDKVYDSATLTTSVRPVHLGSLTKQKFQVISASKDKIYFKQDHVSVADFSSTSTTGDHTYIIEYSDPASSSVAKIPLGSVENAAIFENKLFVSKEGVVWYSLEGQFDDFDISRQLEFSDLGPTRFMHVARDALLVGGDKVTYIIKFDDAGRPYVEKLDLIDPIDNGMLVIGSEAFVVTLEGVFALRFPTAVEPLNSVCVTRHCSHFFDVRPVAAVPTYPDFFRFHVLREDDSIIEFTRQLSGLAGVRYTFERKISNFPYGNSAYIGFDVGILAKYVKHRHNDDNDSLENDQRTFNYSPYLFLDDGAYNQSPYIGDVKRESSNVYKVHRPYNALTLEKPGGIQTQVVMGVTYDRVLIRNSKREYTIGLLRSLTSTSAEIIPRPGHETEWMDPKFDFLGIAGYVLEIPQLTADEYKNDPKAVFMYMDSDKMKVHKASTLNLAEKREPLYWAFGIPYEQKVKLLSSHTFDNHIICGMKIQCFGGGELETRVYDPYRIITMRKTITPSYQTVVDVPVGSLGPSPVSYPNIEVYFQEGMFHGFLAYSFIVK